MHHVEDVSANEILARASCYGTCGGVDPQAFAGCIDLRDTNGGVLVGDGDNAGGVLVLPDPTDPHHAYGKLLSHPRVQEFLKERASSYSLAEADSGYVLKKTFLELHRKMLVDFGMPVESAQRQLERSLAQYSRGGHAVLTYDEFALLCLKFLAKW